MAKSKLAGRDDPPRHIRAREFRKKEKRVEMSRQRKAAQDIDQMIAANLVAEAKAKENSGDQNDNALGTIVLLQKNAPGTDA
ncbi:hypothetical protein KY289_013363 [Solanum tuberosum]|nr:hypothetical protein KY289_013363 [Solanum tuberosum]